MFRTFCICVALACVTGATALAEVKQIGWADLIPDLPALSHPLEDAALSVRKDMARLARLKIDVQQGFLTEATAQAEARAITQAHLSAGIDLRTLEQDIVAFDAEIARRQGVMNEGLDGQHVRLPGYALPLEFSADGATELFLVPFVGACIHVPPPPPNQIVSISLEKPLVLDGLFSPVWVTGWVSIERSSKSLSFVDGSADVSYGYRLTDVQVKPYE